MERGDLIICMDSEHPRYLQIGMIEGINFDVSIWGEVFVVKYPCYEVEEYKKSYVIESFRKIISERV